MFTTTVVAGSRIPSFDAPPRLSPRSTTQTPRSPTTWWNFLYSLSSVSLPRRHSPTPDLRVPVPYHDKHFPPHRSPLWSYLPHLISRTANVGCVREVIKHERLVNDRFFLICKGQERFRVNGLVRTKPYLVAQVTWLEDRPSSSNDLDVDLDGLANKVESYMKDVIQLSNRLGGKQEKEVGDLRRNLFLTLFSFFVGG